jgi:carbon storage regulator
MLVLGRKLNQQVVINDDITITVCRIRGDKVVLGIDAPPEVSVVRPDAKNKEPKVRE